ncbi:hypothetical protein KQX54_006449 [Cotesia glomerata]|uniref:Uncharacterized protein n=1 Tax=Cotesia glomerata TaxID=32391 RepID=A0AAV7IZW7_COTGL|nr:hypothetical protein KQX54_006449 [Cotesia glomerata]
MAAQMLNYDNIKKMLIEDVAFNFNWSDTDSEGYDGDTEEFLNKFHNILNVNSTDEEINYNSQKPEDNNGLNKDSKEHKSTSVGA